ncbi:MAG: hypothetical protein E6J07_01555 [Chloroflexi bacterium]|nr:MAG: hypothetical protein E6J07_01555 [Chloroflexota bacterium]
MRSFGRRVPPWSAALAAYLLLAFLLFLPVWLPPGQRTVGGGGGDPFFSSWFIRWFPHAISHGWNPLFTTYLDYPDGVNLMWNGSIALPSVLLAPVTLSAGPMVAYNLLTTLGPALSGWCAYLAISRYARNRLAAFIGGALYAFSPFMISQSLGHAHLTMAWAPPLALLLLDELLVRRRRSLWIGVALGALGATQLLTAEEVLAIVAVAAAVGLIVAGLLHRQAVWSRLHPALPALGLAAVVFLVVAAVPLGVQFFGPQRVHGPLQPSNYYVSDLLSFLLPTHAQMIAPAAVTRISDHLAGFGEQTAYLGLPLIALLALVIRRTWHLPVVRWAAIAGGALALLSLGDTLHVARVDMRLPLPWALTSAIPLVHEIHPGHSRLAAPVGRGVGRRAECCSPLSGGPVSYVAVGRSRIFQPTVGASRASRRQRDLGCALCRRRDRERDVLAGGSRHVVSDARRRGIRAESIPALSAALGDRVRSRSTGRR